MFHSTISDFLSLGTVISKSTTRTTSTIKPPASKHCLTDSRVIESNYFRSGHLFIPIAVTSASQLAFFGRRGRRPWRTNFFLPSESLRTSEVNLTKFDRVSGLSQLVNLCEYSHSPVTDTPKFRKPL